MKFKMMALAAMAAALGGSTAASAATVDFDSLRSPVYYDLGYATTYAEHGLGFTAIGTDGRDEHMAVWGYDTQTSHLADLDGASVWVNSANALLRIARVGGGTFTLNSLDLADYLNATAPLGTYDMDYAYVDAGGSHTGVFHLDQTPGLQTFTVNLADIQRIDLFTGGYSGAGVQIDNVRFDETAAGVPEPTSWALMLMGFGGLGGLMRRRRSLLASPAG